MRCAADRAENRARAFWEQGRAGKHQKRCGRRRARRVTRRRPRARPGGRRGRCGHRITRAAEGRVRARRTARGRCGRGAQAPEPARPGGCDSKLRRGSDRELPLRARASRHGAGGPRPDGGFRKAQLSSWPGRSWCNCAAAVVYTWQPGVEPVQRTTARPRPAGRCSHAGWSHACGAGWRVSICSRSDH